MQTQDLPHSTITFLPRLPLPGTTCLPATPPLVSLPAGTAPLGLQPACLNCYASLLYSASYGEAAVGHCMGIFPLFSSHLHFLFLPASPLCHYLPAIHLGLHYTATYKPAPAASPCHSTTGLAPPACYGPGDLPACILEDCLPPAPPVGLHIGASACTPGFSTCIRTVSKLGFYTVPALSLGDTAWTIPPRTATVLHFPLFSLFLACLLFTFLPPPPASFSLSPAACYHLLPACHSSPFTCLCDTCHRHLHLLSAGTLPASPAVCGWRRLPGLAYHCRCLCTCLPPCGPLPTTTCCCTTAYLHLPAGAYMGFCLLPPATIPSHLQDTGPAGGYHLPTWMHLPTLGHHYLPPPLIPTCHRTAWVPLPATPCHRGNISCILDFLHLGYLSAYLIQDTTETVASTTPPGICHHILLQVHHRDTSPADHTTTCHHHTTIFDSATPATNTCWGYTRPLYTTSLHSPHRHYLGHSLPHYLPLLHR